MMYERPKNWSMQQPMHRPRSLVLAGAVLAVLGIFVHSVLPQLRARWNAPPRQKMLLYSADHQAIRDEGTALLESLSGPHAPTFTSKFWGGPPDFPDAPACIRALHPTEISVWDGRWLDISCGASSHNYGLRVFLRQRDESGTKQLLDRLWYYDSQNEIPDR